MKYLTFLVILIIPSVAYSWECVDGYEKIDPIEKHIEIASDIIFGRVVEGNFQKGEINFILKPYQVIKGNKKGNIKLSTSFDEWGPGIGIGSNYIVFLYGDERIKYCGRLISVTPNINSIEELIDRPEPDEEEILMYFLNKKGAQSSK